MEDEWCHTMVYSMLLSTPCAILNMNKRNTGIEGMQEPMKMDSVGQ